jgi:hypothetical protein
VRRREHAESFIMVLTIVAGRRNSPRPATSSGTVCNPTRNSRNRADQVSRPQEVLDEGIDGCFHVTDKHCKL